MKQFIRKFFAAAMLLSMTFAFSSCEGSLDDVFGQWDKPSNLPQEVFQFKRVLDRGIPLVFSFKINDVTYSLTITNEGNKQYKVTSTANPDYYTVKELSDDLLAVMIKTGDGDEDLAGDIIFRISDASYFIVNNFNADIIFDGNVSVNGISGTVTNSCPDKMVIKINTVDDNSTLESSLIVYYNKANNETWKEVAKRYDADTTMSGVLFASDSNKNYVSNIDNATNITVELTKKDLVRYNFSSEGKVGIEDKIGDQGGAAFDGPYVADWVPAVLG